MARLSVAAIPVTSTHEKAGTHSVCHLATALLDMRAIASQIKMTRAYILINKRRCGRLVEPMLWLAHKLTAGRSITVAAILGM
jgi:hypothetical protein